MREPVGVDVLIFIQMSDHHGRTVPVSGRVRAAAKILPDPFCQKIHVHHTISQISLETIFSVRDVCFKTGKGTLQLPRSELALHRTVAVPCEVGARHIADLNVRAAEDAFYSRCNPPGARCGGRTELLPFRGVSVEEKALRVLKQYCLIVLKIAGVPERAEEKHGREILLKAAEQFVPEKEILRIQAAGPIGEIAVS